MTEKTVQPGEESCHSHTGDSKTDRTCGTQEALVGIIYHQETHIWQFFFHGLAEMMKYLIQKIFKARMIL